MPDSIGDKHEEGIERLRIRVTGVPCASCVLPIRRALEKANGVKSVGSNYLADLILVDYDPEMITETDIIELVRKTGYTAIPVHE
jgi:Cu+-exporting ATPase